METTKKKRAKKLAPAIDRETKVKNRVYLTSKYTAESASPWWICDKDQVHNDVFGTVRNYKMRWSVPYQELIRHVKRYEDRNYYGYFSNDPYTKFSNNDNLSLNVTASCVDTLHSKITKNTPQVQYTTNSSDFTEEMRAKELQKFIQGHFKFTGAYAKADEALMDCLKFGTGLIHHVIRNDRVFYEIIKPYEVLFDWTDGANGCPYDLHIVRIKNRYEVMQQFPEYKDKLFETSISNPIYSTTQMFNTDNIVIIESYNKYAKRHTICVENCTLLDEDWELKNKYGEVDYPLSVIKFKEADRGFFGIGLAEELKAIHIELTRLVTVAQRSSYLLSVPKIFVPESANIGTYILNNEVGGIIKYAGMTPPTCAPMGSPPVELYSQINMFWQKAYEISGISQMTASSQMPLGLQNASGKALETAYQIESDRFQNVGRRFENLIIDMQDRTIMMMKMIDEQGGDVGNAKYYDKDLAKTINWEDVNMEREQYDLQAFPVNMLPSTPEGKFAFLQDMMVAGLIDPVNAKKQMRIPDTDGYLDLQNSQYDFVMRQITDMCMGKPVEPDINQDFDFATDLVQKAYFYYSNKNLKPIAYENLDNYIKAMERIKITKMAQQQVIMQQALQQAQMNQTSPGGQINEPGSNEPSGFATNQLGSTGGEQSTAA